MPTIDEVWRRASLAPRLAAAANHYSPRVQRDCVLSLAAIVSTTQDAQICMCGSPGLLAWLTELPHAGLAGRCVR